jgi:hypothetical protein
MSLLKANSVQIGQSSTATQNFTLSVPSSPDGTIKLARGNSGATTADILSVSSSGAVTINNLNNQSFRNRIINGDMRIDQRNAGAAVSWAANTNGYTIDRWKLTQNGTVSSTVQRSTNVPAGQGFTNSLLLTVGTAETAVGTGNKTFGYYYMIEGYNVSDLGWGTASAKTITISFWVLSNITGTFSFSVMNTAWNRSYNSSYTITTAGAWEKKTFTVAGDTGATAMDTTNGNALSLVFDLGFSPMYESSTANAWQGSSSYALSGCTKLSSTVGGVFYITGVQLEAGSSATEFERRPIGTELALCQRYYDKSYSMNVAPGTNTPNGMVQGIMETYAGAWYQGGGSIRFSTEMRRVPDFNYRDYQGTLNRFTNFWTGTYGYNINPTVTLFVGTKAVSILETAGPSGGWSGSPLMCHYTADAEL